MPLIPGDSIITDKNGGVSLAFPDGTSTEIHPSQHWTLSEYTPGVGLKKLSLPVDSKWYYGSLIDARTMTENRLPNATLFDAYTEFSQGDTVSQIPRQITLTLPSPTEIDFQSYFPADTLSNVEIFRLPSSQYRRVSSTKIAFESQKNVTEILVRVTVGDRVRDYTTRLVSIPPRLSIDTLSSDGQLSGEIISAPSSLPLGVQSYIDGKSWLLSSGFSSSISGTSFETSVVRTSSKV
ncbi:hypothetical protein H6768_06290 [Candidatus Peribacteria bacterium]|nr:hypothetical protein [Candidatus Peribacteria bacterium]